MKKPLITVEDLPNIKLTANGNYRQAQPFTKANLIKVMQLMNITARFDMMAAGTVLYQDGKRLEPGVGYSLIADALTMVDINNISRLDETLKEISNDDPFHPMEDWLNTLEWDGKDRISDLAASITTSNPLWPTYLENWLVQTVEGVCGWRKVTERSLSQVLVLVGGQGLGKSYWLAKLGGQWFKGEAELHLSTPSGKDHQIAVLRHPMAELSELGGTFRKADVDSLKSFISRGIDEIRAPYERRAVIRPRMTAFCASVNDTEFLNDSSGSRRFWPVEVQAIDWEFDMQWNQLWAQAHDYWKENPNFTLTAEEDALRASTAINQHTLPTAEAERISEYYRRHHGNPKYPDVAMNRTEILEMLYGSGRSWSPRQVAEAGRVLTDIISKSRTIDGKQRAWPFPYNQFATDLSAWPDKYHLEIVKPDTPRTQ